MKKDEVGTDAAVVFAAVNAVEAVVLELMRGLMAKGLMDRTDMAKALLRAELMASALDQSEGDQPPGPREQYVRLIQQEAATALGMKPELHMQGRRLAEWARSQKGENPVAAKIPLAEEPPSAP